MIEVADTSLLRDRTIKVPLRGLAGIGEVWLAALVRNQIEIHRRPAPDGYRRSRTHGPDDRLVPTV